MKNTGNNLLDPCALSDDALRGHLAYLAEFMLPERVRNFEATLAMRTRYLCVCLENTFHPQNASALVRTCEAFGIQQIHTVEQLCHFSPNTHIVRGTDKWVDIRRHPSTPELLGELKAQGLRIVATSPRAGGDTPETFDIAAGPFALFFGTEHAGISPTVEQAADHFLHIPMCGLVESLNVSASAAILLYTLTTRLRTSPAPWHLPPRERDEILLRWMITTLRDPAGILSRYPGPRE